MNVGELRKALEGVSDDAIVAIEDPNGGGDYGAYAVNGDCFVYEKAFLIDELGIEEDDGEDDDYEDDEDDDYEDDEDDDYEDNRERVSAFIIPG